MVVLCAAALVRGMVGDSILPWPVLLVVLAMAGGGFVILMLRVEVEEVAVPLPTPQRNYKKHKPRGRAKKRVIRNAFKRRRVRKAGGIILSHETNIAHPGEQQVGFFG